MSHEVATTPKLYLNTNEAGNWTLKQRDQTKSHPYTFLTIKKIYEQNIL